MLAGKDLVVLLEREPAVNTSAAMLAEALAGDGGALLVEGPPVSARPDCSR